MRSAARRLWRRPTAKRVQRQKSRDAGKQSKSPSVWRDIRPWSLRGSHFFGLSAHRVKPFPECRQALLLHVVADEKCGRAGEFYLAVHLRGTIGLRRKVKAMLDGYSHHV